MDEMQMSMTIKVNFRIIFFDDYLRNRIVESLKEQFFEEQINIVESELFGKALKYHYDAYVDEALIDKYGFKKIKEKIDEEMKQEFKLLIDIDKNEV